MDKLNSNDIVLDFGDIKIRLFENYNETKIDKLLRTAKNVIIAERVGESTNERKSFGSCKGEFCI